jgi:hypothetical protein
LISNDELAHAADVGAIGNTLVAIGSHGDGGPGTTGGVWVGSLP